MTTAIRRSTDAISDLKADSARLTELVRSSDDVLAYVVAYYQTHQLGSLRGLLNAIDSLVEEHAQG